MQNIAMPTKNCRSSERTYDAYPVLVSVKTNDGNRLKIKTETKNISSGGLFMYMPYLSAHCNVLFTFIQLPGGARLTAISQILRTENNNDESTGVALCFKHTRLFPEINSGYINMNILTGV